MNLVNGRGGSVKAGDPPRKAMAGQPEPLGGGRDGDEAVAAPLLHVDDAGHFGEQGVVTPQTDVFPGLEPRPALAHADAPPRHRLTGEGLHAQAPPGAIAAVPRASHTLLVCHRLLRVLRRVARYATISAIRTLVSS